MKTIETPYGRKTPEMLCKAMDAYNRQPELLEALRSITAQCYEYAMQSPTLNPAIDAVILQAYKAIAKAEGREGE